MSNLEKCFRWWIAANIENLLYWNFKIQIQLKRLEGFCYVMEAKALRGLTKAE